MKRLIYITVCFRFNFSIFFLKKGAPKLNLLKKKDLKQDRRNYKTQENKNKARTYNKKQGKRKTKKQNQNEKGSVCEGCGRKQEAWWMIELVDPRNVCRCQVQTWSFVEGILGLPIKMF